MKTNLLAVCVILIAPYSIESITYECEIVEKYDSQGLKYCVFRDVQYFSNTTDIAFKPPAETTPRVAFESSHMEHLPKEFLEKFGRDLKVLKVTSCKLKSVVITKSMEELIAIDNYIATVIVHQNAQNSPMKELHLPSNRLSDISNITRHCKHLRILDLSRNQKLAKDSEIDFSKFNGLDELEYLSLADVGALYILHNKKVALPSLTVLDLSMNNLLPSDLHVDYFQSFKSLEILRLNNNGFGQLDYNDLTKMESLKEVYLEGNEFTCSYLKIMIEFLNDKGKQTPVARQVTHCPAGYNIEHQMCCKSDNLAQMEIVTKKPMNRDNADQVVETVTQPSVHTVTTKTPSTATAIPKEKTDLSGKNTAAALLLNVQMMICGFVISFLCPL